MEKPYKDITALCKEKYQKKLYRLSLSLGTTCPNRTGEAGVGGCIFCSGAGSGDFAEYGSINTQIENAKKRISAKIKGDVGYIAYFQSFTTTYMKPLALREGLMQAAGNKDITVVSVATRPDCMDEKTVEVLREVSKVKPLWIELGLQSSDNATAKLINRGYKTEVFGECVKKISDFADEIIAHIIIGLPKETEKELYATIGYVNSLNISGVKLHLLHVLKNTPLEKMEYTPLSIEEYAELLCGCIKRLNKNITVHRITGDGNKKELLAPMWSADKKAVLNYLWGYMQKNNIKQGQL